LWEMGKSFASNLSNLAQILNATAEIKKYLTANPLSIFVGYAVTVGLAHEKYPEASCSKHVKSM